MRRPSIISLSLFVLFTVHVFALAPAFRLTDWQKKFNLFSFISKLGLILYLYLQTRNFPFSNNFVLFHSNFSLMPNSNFLLISNNNFPLMSNNFSLVSTSTSNLWFTFNINFRLCQQHFFVNAHVYYILFVTYFAYILTNTLYNHSSFCNQFQQPIVLFLASTTSVIHFVFFYNHALQQFNQPFFSTIFFIFKLTISIVLSPADFLPFLNLLQFFGSDFSF